MFRRLVTYLLYSFLAFLIGLSIRDYEAVISGSGLPPSITLTGYLLSVLRRSSFVIEERDVYPEMAIALGYVKSNLLIKLWKRYHQFFRKRATVVIALTPGIQRILVSRGIDPDQIAVVTNGFDCEEAFRGSSETPLKYREILDSHFVVLYTGGMGQVADLDTLLKAANRLRDYESIAFFIVGDGEHRERYKRYVRNHGLENCYLPGAMPKKMMSAYYARADVCVHLVPEGDVWKCVLPNKVFDYLGSGCAMIYAGKGDTAELLEEANAGIVCQPGDEEAVSEAICYLYEHTDERKKMGENARQHIEQNYSLNQKFQEYETILSRACER